MDETSKKHEPITQARNGSFYCVEQGGDRILNASRPATGYPFSFSWRVHAVHSRLGVVGAAIDYISMFLLPASTPARTPPVDSSLEILSEGWIDSAQAGLTHWECEREIWRLFPESDDPCHRRTDYTLRINGVRALSISDPGCGLNVKTLIELGGPEYCSGLKKFRTDAEYDEAVRRRAELDSILTQVDSILAP